MQRRRARPLHRAGVAVDQAGASQGTLPVLSRPVGKGAFLPCLPDSLLLTPAMMCGDRRKCECLSGAGARCGWCADVLSASLQSIATPISQSHSPISLPSIYSPSSPASGAAPTICTHLHPTSGPAVTSLVRSFGHQSFWFSVLKVFRRRLRAQVALSLSTTRTPPSARDLSQALRRRNVAANQFSEDTDAHRIND